MPPTQTQHGDGFVPLPVPVEPGDAVQASGYLRGGSYSQERFDQDVVDRGYACVKLKRFYLTIRGFLDTKEESEEGASEDRLLVGGATIC